MADIGWRRRRGSSSAARRGARQRAGLTLAFASNTLHASGRRFIHNSSGQSKNPIDSDHGIYRYTAATRGRGDRMSGLKDNKPRATTASLRGNDPSRPFHEASVSILRPCFGNSASP
jgi:hypothetical protein